MDRICPGRATRALLLALLAGLWTAPAFAWTSSQSATQPPQPSASDSGAQAGQQPKPDSAKKRSSTASQTVPDAPAAPNAPAKPDTSAPASESDQQAKPPSAAQDNPFPEDVSRAAAKDAASSSSNSGVSSSSSYDPGVDRGDRDPDVGRRKLPKPSEDVDVGSLSATARAKKDVEVGKFYLGTGDDQGAYTRFADAGKMDPSNVDAIFGLAEAARHLQRTQEAIANYQLFLEIEPDGSRAKLARKALNGLNVKK